MKNKLIDLNNHLFAQMERLSDEELKGDALNEEIRRSQAVSTLANQIISNGQLALKAQMAINDGIVKRAPKMLGVEGDED
jgi:hypothetical protein